MTNKIVQDLRIDPRIKAVFGNVPVVDLPDAEAGNNY